MQCWELNQVGIHIDGIEVIEVIFGTKTKPKLKIRRQANLVSMLQTNMAHLSMKVY